jgi:hypothetical protein
MAQDSVIFFIPKPIDEALTAKPFFKKGVMFEVDNVKYENDTNYFTLYFVNNADTPITVITTNINYNFKNTFLYLVSMQSIPTNYQPYKKILRLSMIAGGSHDVTGTDTLFPGYYIKQTIKVACPACKEADKKTVRLSIYDYTGYERGKSRTYFSNGFQVYYHPLVFARFNLRFHEMHYQLKPDSVTINNAHVYEAYRLNDSAKPQIRVYLEGFLSNTISIKELTGKLKVYDNNTETNKYQLSRCVLMLIRGTDRGIVHIAYADNGILEKESLQKIKDLKQGDEIDFSFIEITDPSTGGIFDVLPINYIID